MKITPDHLRFGHWRDTTPASHQHVPDQAPSPIAPAYPSAEHAARTQDGGERVLTLSVWPQQSGATRSLPTPADLPVPEPGLSHAEQIELYSRFLLRSFVSHANL